MECNRDEAAKAKELAEKKFLEKDLIGAQKFAKKAHTLFPDLNGLSQLQATLGMYVSAERKINGEIDWYGVLGVPPSTDDDTLKQQYRKLALILHPDKNKSVGADGAFKVLSEAWSVLSNKARRTEYDCRRFQNVVYPKVSTINPSSSTTTNGFHSAKHKGTPSMRAHKSPKFCQPVQQTVRTDTFWTACSRCRMQYEYLRTYINQRLRCPQCQEPFYAIEMPPPELNGHLSWPPYIQPQASNHQRATENSFNPAVPAYSEQKSVKRSGEESRASATLEGALKSRTHAFKRAYVYEGNGSSSMGNEKPNKKAHTLSEKLNDVRLDKANQTTWGTREASHRVDNVAVYGSKFGNPRREPTVHEVRSILMNKAIKGISKHLGEWKNVIHVPRASQKASGVKGKGTKKFTVDCSTTPVNSTADVLENDEIKHAASVNVTSLKPGKCDTSSPASNVDEPTESIGFIMNVPDPDFHDFDKDRSEDSFSDNQVWAAYDDDDGMPRYYAIISSMISRKPFQMRISWLNSKSTSEFGSNNWVQCGFYKTCGDFRIGRYEMNNSINSFSHKVSWSKGSRGLIQIYPKKGDVWALYTNWSPEWNEHTPDDLIHKYDMVEVLENYDEEKGTTVVPLIKVTGYKTVFRKQQDPGKVRRILKEEMLRFSHQVPSCLLTGDESPNAPKGCWELDPAATPLELLKVTSGDEGASHDSSRGDLKVENDDNENPIVIS